MQVGEGTDDDANVDDRLGVTVAGEDDGGSADQVRDGRLALEGAHEDLI